MPLWFANGTDATTGNRVITAPIGAPANRNDTARDRSGARVTSTP